MPQLHQTSLDGILSLVPNLRVLSIAAEYISGLFLPIPHIPPGHPLETLELDNADPPLLGFKVTAKTISWAIMEGGLPRLRRVMVHKRLGWLATVRDREDVEDLSELLEAKAMEDISALGGGPVVPPGEAGVWGFQ